MDQFYLSSCQVLCNPYHLLGLVWQGDFLDFLSLISSEGALYVIMPYDYPAQRSTHFLNTHRSLITTLIINAVMTLLTVISMKTKITEIT